uniref:Uncharacterized protein n=1 Tax=Anopheles atroparvus TaxID=41427 RepID=A0A182IST9_ANOAO
MRNIVPPCRKTSSTTTHTHTHILPLASIAHSIRVTSTRDGFRGYHSHASQAAWFAFVAGAGGDGLAPPPPPPPPPPPEGCPADEGCPVALFWPPCTPPCTPLPVGCPRPFECWPALPAPPLLPAVPLPPVPSRCFGWFWPPPAPPALDPLPPVRHGFTSSPQLSAVCPCAPPPPPPPTPPPPTALFELTCAWCMNALIVAWYSAGAVCTESGVESLGGVGGKENRCWPVWPPCTWLSLSCGSCGQANGLPHGLPDAIGFGGSLSQERGPWKCGRQTCGVTCDELMRDAAERGEPYDGSVKSSQLNSSAEDQIISDEVSPPPFVGG